MRRFFIGLGLGILLTVLIIFAFRTGHDKILKDRTVGAFIGTSSIDEADIEKEMEAEAEEGTNKIEAKAIGKIKEIILKTLELYSHASDPIKKSRLVTQINQLVADLANSAINEAWETFSLCLAESCSSKGFLDFIRVNAVEAARGGDADAKMIVNLLTAYKYWETDNIIKFSEAMNALNNEVERRNSTELTNTWIKLVECDGSCPEEDDLIFDMLNSIFEKQQEIK